MIGAVRSHQLGGDAPQVAKRERKYNESHDQREVVKWLRAPERNGAWLVMRCENAAKRTPAQAARDHALGMEDGAPDLLVCFHSFAFFIEMKSLTGRVSDAQASLHMQLRRRGHAVLVGYGHERTIAALSAMERAWAYWHGCKDTSQRDAVRSIIETENARGK